MTPARPPDPDASGADRSRPVPRALLFLVIVAALLARWPSLSAGFLNYDDPQIRADVAAKSPLDLVTGPTYYAYKPVYGLSMWVDEHLFGDAPLGWHVGNVLLFALACALLTLLVSSATGVTALGVGAGLLLAVHPVHTESVAWVAERKDSLSLVLALLAHLAYRRSRTRAPGRIPLLAPALLLLAGFAKGTVWTWAGLVAIDEAVTRAAPPGRLRRLAPMLLVCLGGIALDGWAGAAYGPGSVSHPASMAELAAAMAGVHARYVASLVWPSGLSIDYPVDPAGAWSDPWALCGVLLALLAVAGLVVGVRRRSPALAFGCGLWVLGLAPVNNVWPSTSVLRADRYLLVPAAGAYLLLAAALARVPRARVVGLGVLAVAFGILAARRAGAFVDSRTVWTDAIEAQPATVIGRINRAADAAERGIWDRVEPDAVEAIRLGTLARRPEWVLRARLLRVAALLQVGARQGPAGLPQVDAALAEARTAVAESETMDRNPWVKGDPRQVRAAAHSAVGQALETRARLADDPSRAREGFDAAIAAYRRATESDPTAFDAWTNLGNLLAATGGEARLEDAAAALRRAAALRPDHVDTIGQLVTVLVKQGRDAEAKLVFDDASRRLGEPRGLRRLSARLKVETGGDPAAADAGLEALLAGDPDDRETRAVLHGLRRGVAQRALAEGRTKKDRTALERAVVAYDRVLLVAPGDMDAHVGAGDALLALGRAREARERYARARALSPKARWLRTIEARAGLLDVLSLLWAGDRDPALRAFASLVRLEPPRLDLGFTALEAELLWLLPVAEASESSSGAEAAVAANVLEGAALLVGGDEDGARRALSAALSSVGASPAPGSRLEKVVDAALLLRSIVRSRRAEVAGARADVEPILARRPKEALVAHQLLGLDRIEAVARRRIAEGAGDAAALEAARATLRRLRERASALAAADPPWPGPALTAAELDLEQGEYLDALRRLATAADRFPADPSVHRGRAAVYQAQMLRGGSRGPLLEQAQAALIRAKELDPRDPRTSLDLSQLYRLAGDLETAARYALLASSYEPIPGDASRALAAILVEQGRKALEARELDKATGLASSAAVADPRGAAPYVLEGDVWLERQELDKALASYRRARELEPASAEAIRALAECHRRRGGAYFLYKLRYPRPAAREGMEPDPKVLADWEQKHALAVRQALSDLEAALRLEPDGEEAESTRQRMEQVRRLDPDAPRRTREAALAAFDVGEGFRRAGKKADALFAYRESAAAWSQLLPAWMRIAEMGLDLGREHDGEVLHALEMVRDLDSQGEFVETDLYAGRVWARRVVDAPDGVAGKHAAGIARGFLGRYVDRAAPRGGAQAENVALARRLLAGLPR